jgi:hydroxymethylpyrimidine pyrophosphatase-like HAD family hydrolase
MNAYIFDVDGVITNPYKKQVKEKEILKIIAGKLKSNEPVAFNTGRTIQWVVDRVITPLLELIEDKSVLRNLFVVGEKGGIWLTFDRNGKAVTKRDYSILMLQRLQDRLRTLAEKEFSDYVFYDDKKQTMITLEVKDDVPLEKFNEIHPLLNKRISEILSEEDPDHKFKFTPTTLDTDVENVYVGKGFAIKRIIGWIVQRNIDIDRFVTFGDSPADAEMAHEIYSQEQPLIYVYVGEKPLEENYPFETYITHEKFDRGTLEYLTKNA